MVDTPQWLDFLKHLVILQKNEPPLDIVGLLLRTSELSFFGCAPPSPIQIIGDLFGLSIKCGFHCSDDHSKTLNIIFNPCGRRGSTIKPVEKFIKQILMTGAGNGRRFVYLRLLGQLGG